MQFFEIVRGRPKQRIFQKFLREASSLKLVGSEGINEKIRGYLKRAKLEFQMLEGQKGKLVKPGRTLPWPPATSHRRFRLWAVAREVVGAPGISIGP